MATKRNTKPVPVQIKILRGTYRKDRDGKSIALKMTTLDVIPEAPAHFNQKQKDLWKTICETLHRIGALQVLGLMQIRVFCEQFAIYEEAADHVKEFGPFLKTSDGKKSYKNPSLTIMRTTFKIMLRISDQFGFTPLAQSRLK